MIFAFCIFITAAIVYGLMYLLRRGRVVRHRRVVNVPTEIGPDYEFTCVLGVNGSPSKCTVKRITPE